MLLDHGRLWAMFGLLGDEWICIYVDWLNDDGCCGCRDQAGATTLNVPDTVGYTTPGEFFNLIQGLRTHVKGIDGVTISVHGHDDLGMAVANFLAAIEGEPVQRPSASCQGGLALVKGTIESIPRLGSTSILTRGVPGWLGAGGARQVECTINGIGERAGNAALEEIVMALQVRRSFYNPRFGRTPDCDTPLTNIRTTEIYKTSRLVSTLTGMMIQPNKAIVGANAFAHESGIHQDGILKNKLTYEIMDAESIGLATNELVLGKHSGRAAFRARLTELGYELTDGELNKAFVRFKDLADKKKEITNLDLESIVNDEIRLEHEEAALELLGVQVVCGDSQVPTATIRLLDKRDSREHLVASTGTGPVDAAYEAVDKAIGLENIKLLEFAVTSVTAGIDALGEVTVRVQDDSNSKIYYGRSANTDIVVAATQAYLFAINRIIGNRRGSLPTHPQFGRV
jgi:2-isopropylmalate synthase